MFRSSINCFSPSVHAFTFCSGTHPAPTPRFCLHSSLHCQQGEIVSKLYFLSFCERLIVDYFKLSISGEDSAGVHGEEIRRSSDLDVPGRPLDDPLHLHQDLRQPLLGCHLHPAGHPLEHLHLHRWFTCNNFVKILTTTILII